VNGGQTQLSSGFGEHLRADGRSDQQQKQNQQFIAAQRLVAMAKVNQRPD
jgi:hypothetical protein